MASARICKDCIAEGATSKRAAPHPGPRCATHHRERRETTRNAAHAKHVEQTYNITIEQYWAIYEVQGGRCYICQRASGAKRRLAVDHDHKCCNGPTSCGNCVRGLLCLTCNKKVIGHLRDDPAALRRAADYLESPPARLVLVQNSTCGVRRSDGCPGGTDNSGASTVLPTLGPTGEQPRMEPVPVSVA